MPTDIQNNQASHEGNSEKSKADDDREDGKTERVNDSEPKDLSSQERGPKTEVPSEPGPQSGDSRDAEQEEERGDPQEANTVVVGSDSTVLYEEETDFALDRDIEALDTGDAANVRWAMPSSTSGEGISQEQCSPQAPPEAAPSVFNVGPEASEESVVVADVDAGADMGAELEAETPSEETELLAAIEAKSKEFEDVKRVLEERRNERDSLVEKYRNIFDSVDTVLLTPLEATENQVRELTQCLSEHGILTEEIQSWQSSFRLVLKILRRLPRRKKDLEPQETDISDELTDDEIQSLPASEVKARLEDQIDRVKKLSYQLEDETKQIQSRISKFIETDVVTAMDNVVSSLNAQEATFSGKLDGLTEAVAANLSPLLSTYENVCAKMRELFSVIDIAPLDVQVGDDFNEEIHYCLGTEKPDDDSNIGEVQVKSVLRDGYLYGESSGGGLVRPAEVIVAKNE